MNQTSTAASSTSVSAAPVTESARIGSLDLLRGFAVLGILVMNIQSFAMPDPAYFNPSVYGDLSGINFAAWLVSHLFADMKFMSIFSMLFGAGIVLFCQRLEQSNLKPAGVHYRRTFLLLLFGLLHAYLLWTGDILVWYAESSLIAYLFWRKEPRRLLIWSMLLLLIGTGLYALFQWSLPYWPPEAVEGNRSWWIPGPGVLEQRLEAYRSGWLSQMSERIPASLVLQTFVYLIWGVWRTLGMMLLGMALVKWGVLSAQRPRRFYVVLAVTGLAVGLPIIAYGAWQNIAHEWSYQYSMFGGSLFNYWGSIAVALAYVSLIMLWFGSNIGSRLKQVLSAVGRTAFSSYIAQTLICTTLFYGHGFGLFGSVPRWGQLAIVPAVWLIVIIGASFSVRRFRFGPLEWLWRSLTYKKRQPMRLAIIAK